MIAKDEVRLKGSVAGSYVCVTGALGGGEGGVHPGEHGQAVPEAEAYSLPVSRGVSVFPASAS